MRHIFEFGYKVGVLSYKKTNGYKLTIHESECTDDNLYTPAKSMDVYTLQALKDLVHNINHFIDMVEKEKKESNTEE